MQNKPRKPTRFVFSKIGVFSAMFLMISILAFRFFALAEVTSTKEPTAGNTVYIAGNPDLFPLEYYNEKTKEYQGILPSLYKQISAQSGLKFTYISADTEDRQKQLGENFQVEIVSAYCKGEISVAKEIELFCYEKNGEKQTVCIGLTKIVDPAVASAVAAAVQNADKNVWLSAAMQLEDRPDGSTAVFWLLAVILLLVAALTALLIYLLRKRRRTREQSEMKQIDPLTGIGNAMYFENCYLHYVSAATRALYYVCYISLDIEKIETYYEATVAKELQRYAADTISGALDDNDFAARIGNGVFAVCFMCPDSERAVKTVEEWIDRLNQYNETSAKEVLFRCGIYPLDKKNIPFETVLYNARQGYLFAESEKQLVCLVDKNILSRVTMKSRLQKKIAAAIKKEEFQIYLQFVFDPNKKKLCGAEVLTRWHSPEEGVLSPANYIEDMTVAGMINRLDLYVFEKACQILAQWEKQGVDLVYLSCNFTRATLSGADFLEQFNAILCKYEFERSRLLIELTEDSLVSDSNVAYKNILAIKDLGCKIALDDFGSGYTSFSDLCDYPVDIIKIDRHIVLKADDSRGYAVLTSIIRMAHALGIDVLCEGVEKEQENERVIEAGSDFIQGFFHSRVLPLENAMAFYKDKQ